MWIALAFFCSRSPHPFCHSFLDPERKVTPVHLLCFDVINLVFACTMDVYCVRACVRAYSWVCRSILNEIKTNPLLFWMPKLVHLPYTLLASILRSSLVLFCSSFPIARCHTKNTKNHSCTWRVHTQSNCVKYTNLHTKNHIHKSIAFAMHALKISVYSGNNNSTADMFELSKTETVLLLL